MNTETAMSNFVEFDEVAIANEYRKTMGNNLTHPQIEEGLKSLNDVLRVNTKRSAGTVQRYQAHASLVAIIFWARIHVTVVGGKSVIGDGGGVYTPGGGGIWGNLYTSDIERLYRDSYSYQMSATAFYMGINFFDGNSNYLGSFHGGGLGIVTGTGGGRITKPWN